MDNTQPVGNIKPQILSNTPVGIETTLVNDTIALVNDPNALVGSQSTPIAVIRTKTSSNAPKGSITQRH